MCMEAAKTPCTEVQKYSYNIALIFSTFTSCFRTNRFAVAENWFKLPLQVIDSNKAVTEHSLEKSFQ